MDFGQSPQGYGGGYYRQQRYPNNQGQRYRNYYHQQSPQPSLSAQYQHENQQQGYQYQPRPSGQYQPQQQAYSGQYNPQYQNSYMEYPQQQYQDGFYQQQQQQQYPQTQIEMPPPLPIPPPPPPAPQKHQQAQHQQDEFSQQAQTPKQLQIIRPQQKRDFQASYQGDTNRGNHANNRWNNRNTGAKILNFSRGEISTCNICSTITACFHGFHKHFGDAEFFKLLNSRVNGISEGATEKKNDDDDDFDDDRDDDGDDDKSEDGKKNKLIKHMFGVVCEMLEFYYSDEQSRTFEHSETTQERMIVHSLCHNFGFVSNSVGFHPKRRVHVAKVPGSQQEIRGIPLSRLNSIVRECLKNTKTISGLEKKDSRKKGKTDKSAKDEKSDSNEKEEEEEEEKGTSESEEEDEDDKETGEDGSPQKKRPKVVSQAQTDLEEPPNLDELKERIRIQIDQELQLIATGSELIEKLNNIEHEISENYSVPSFENLKYGSFISFLSSNKDMIGNISVGNTKNASESAQDSLLSRIPSHEELCEYVSQYAAHHDTKAVDKVVHSVFVQFDIPVKCFKEVYAKVDAILKSEVSIKAQQTSKYTNRQYLRAYMGESMFENWTPEKPFELPRSGCPPPMLSALAWGCVSKRQNISSADASAAFEESDLVFLDGGAVVKRTDGKNLCRAITVCDPWAAVSEIVSLVLGNDGKLPIELCSQQCARGFAAVKLDPHRFLLDFLKLLPQVFYETMDGAIKSAVLDPFVNVFGRLDSSFFSSVTDLGDRAYLKCVLSLLGVDVTGFTDSLVTKEISSTNGNSENVILEKVKIEDVKEEKDENEKKKKHKKEKKKKKDHDGSSSKEPEIPGESHGNSPKSVIDDIRCYEFGIGMETDTRTQKTLKAQYEREARAIERLSSELYTRDSHFFLELLQNADDNRYPSEPGFCPTLELEFTPEALIVRNNELGFSERDVRAICDIANSTKTSTKRAEIGQTGEKGIGFKAVFRVSDKPQIHSNGYHFEFDADSEPVRFIVPRWIGEDGNIPQQELGTTILLPWRKDVAHKFGSLFNHMTSMNAESLLFLRRLSKVVVKNAATGEERTISREIQPISPESGATLVRICVDATDKSEWLVVERKLSPQIARKGIPVSQTALSLGFRLTEEHGAYADEFCSVCALLPLCASKFRFIVQGDFVSSASREGLDEDVAWNQWLRGEVPDTFVHAVRTVFLTAATDLRYTWYAFVPMPRDGTGLFGSVPTEILRKLSSLECVVAEDGSLALPKRTLLVPDVVRRLFPQSAIDAAFGNSLRYCHTRISGSAAILQLLGVQSFDVSHLVTLLAKLNELPVPKDDAWFHDLFEFLCDYAEPILLKDSDTETVFYDSLKTARFIPTEGSSCKLEDPASVFLMKQDEEQNEDVDMEDARSNESSDTDSKMVRFAVLRSFEPVLKSKVLSLLQKLGVRTYSEHEHILKHVIPALPDLVNEDAILAKTMTVYKHWKSCSICLSDSRSLSRKLFNGLPILLLKSMATADKQKICFLKDACVHFRQRFQAEGAASELWNVLSDVYPSHLHDFFVFVGVRESLGVYPEQEVVSFEDSAATWNGVALPPAIGNSYRVDDFVCPEFSILVGGIRNLSPSDACSAMEQLVRICEDDWLVLSKFVTAKLHYHDQATGNELSQDVPSTFVSRLRSKKWILSGRRASEDPDKQNYRFRAPSSLFMDRPECAEYTGDIGPYPKVAMSESFAKEIGVHFAVTPDDALALLRRWVKTNKTEQTREQMESLYKKASESPALKGSPELMIFDPKRKQYVSPSQAFWDDPSESFVSLVDSGYAPDMKDVFVNNYGVRMYPEQDVYIRMLKDLAGTPKEEAARAAFGAFAHFGRLIEEGVLETTDRRWRKLGGKVIFPTNRFHWVSAKDHVYINDDKSFPFKSPPNGLFYMYLPTEHRLLSQGINFAGILGVKRISDVLSMRSITDELEPDNELLGFVQDNIVYIQRFVKKRYPETYAALGEDFASALAEFRVFTASKISCVWCIDNFKETSPIPCNVLLCECTLYYRRNKKMHSYDSAVFSELSKFFLGRASDTTVMTAFLDMLAGDDRNEEFSEKMEEYIGPELEDGERRWEIHFDRPEKHSPEGMETGNAPATTNISSKKKDVDEENNCGIQVLRPSASSNVSIQPDGIRNSFNVDGDQEMEEARGMDLGEKTLNTLDDEEKRKIGDRGEKIVFDTLRSEYPHDTVVWCNESNETGLPYDLVVSDSNGSNKRFIEVKATKTSDKSIFEVSFKEWMFSQEHRGKFFIYRVFDALGDDPKILKIQNPFKEWSTGNLGMFLYIKGANNDQTKLLK